ncbi:MAG: PhoH family protein [Peptoniphilaceae bacterium]|nr:PhoH family protein [Peptoniphilaceae bacterium]MDD7383515.1 PhoH family protein [Peptoniphilaceae bacterium]MDY3738688.1 PhoH family protein [Peptoniphilaceae bacterium]
MINIKKDFEINNTDYVAILFGNLDSNKKYIEERLSVKLKLKDGKLTIEGDEVPVLLAKKVIEQLYLKIEKDNFIDNQSLKYCIDLITRENREAIKPILDEVITTTAVGKPLKPKTLGQKNYIEKIKNNDIVFGIGPAGTGKTYLAMAMAIKSFRNNEVNRIILTRPAVEAGESLGFLPGDLQEKVDPYLRPLYDALYEILGYDNYITFVEKGLIEVAPLAYMRGRTLDNAFVILDEAQNTTYEQMKMFLTRIGYGSKAIITGDTSQIDLPRGKNSGLVAAEKILSSVDGIEFMNFSDIDVVRHPLVQRIINAYGRYEAENESFNR